MQQEDARRPSIVRRIVSWSRYIVIVPILALFAGAISLVGIGAVTTFTTIAGILDGHVGEKEALVEFITLADLFLLSTVLYIIALGLYELFIDDQLPVPRWLEIHSLEDLKEKLIGVVVVVLAVLFLGVAVKTADPKSVAFTGVGAAAVIAALGYFVGTAMKNESAAKAEKTPRE